MRSLSARAHDARKGSRGVRSGISGWVVGAVTLGGTLLSSSAWAASAELSASTSDEAPAATAPSNDGAPAAGSREAAANALTQEQVEAYLDSHALPKSPGLAGDGGVYAEVPPPPPRHRGLVVEASPGVYFPLGAMGHISPPSPWLQAIVGYELTHWFMVLGHADLTIASTSFGAEPPPSRTYAQYGFGAAGRFQYEFNAFLAAHAQIEVGLAEVTDDVLAVYGFPKADELGLFYGGRLGLEWLQVNPHLALALTGTIRDYPNLERSLDSEVPLALIGALSLRYAF